MNNMSLAKMSFSFFFLRAKYKSGKEKITHMELISKRILYFLYRYNVILNILVYS